MANSASYPPPSLCSVSPLIYFFTFHPHLSLYSLTLHLSPHFVQCIPTHFLFHFSSLPLTLLHHFSTFPTYCTPSLVTLCSHLSPSHTNPSLFIFPLSLYSLSFHPILSRSYIYSNYFSLLPTHFTPPYSLYSQLTSLLDLTLSLQYLTSPSHITPSVFTPPYRFPMYSKTAIYGHCFGRQHAFVRSSAFYSHFLLKQSNIICLYCALTKDPRI